MTNKFRLVALLTLLLAPWAQAGNDDLTLRDAQRLLFPTAKQFVEQQRDVTAVWQKAAAAGSTENFGAMRLVIREARNGDTLLGYLVTDAVIGKFEKIDYAVALSTSGAVQRVEILKYREKHGQEVKRRQWLDQFAGRDAGAALKLEHDVDNITGATLSCAHLTDGIRRITRVFAAGLQR